MGAKFFQVNETEVRGALKDAEIEGFARSNLDGVMVRLPRRDGTVGVYRVFAWDIFKDVKSKTHGLQKAYYGFGVTDRTERVFFDYSPRGLKAMVMGSRGTTFIEPLLNTPDPGQYYVYTTADRGFTGRFGCAVIGGEGASGPTLESLMADSGGGMRSGNVEIVSFRLAITTTGEYTAHFGSASLAEMAVRTTVARVNGIYRTDFGIELPLIDVKCYPVASQDPFPDLDPQNPNVSDLMLPNHQDIVQRIGTNGFEVGHIFTAGFANFPSGLNASSIRSSGVANIGSVGHPNSKGEGVTGSGYPQGDVFDVDYFAHELGHQFGLTHTFNGTRGACGGVYQWAPLTAWEPGSGTTIMGYAGICNNPYSLIGMPGSDNLANNSDPNFHGGSISQVAGIRDNASISSTRVSTLNRRPIFESAPAQITILEQTRFKLSATATDPDGDTLTYTWEQLDPGPQMPLIDPRRFTVGPLFRSYPPTENGTGFFPPQDDPGPISGLAERPVGPRTMHFRCTVRDGRGGVAFQNRIVNVLSGGLLDIYKEFFDNITVNPLGFTFSGNVYPYKPGTSEKIIIGSSDWARTQYPFLNIRFHNEATHNYFTGDSLLVAENIPNIPGMQTITIPEYEGSMKVVVESPDGTFFNFSENGLSYDIAINPAPIASPGNLTQTIDEEAEFSALFQATDPWDDILSWSLVGSVPAGVEVVPTGLRSCQLRWTPTEAQGGRTFSFRLRVEDDGFPVKSDEVPVLLTVRKVSPTLKLLRGTANLQGLASSPAGKGLSIQILNQTSGAVVQSLSTTLQNLGTFSTTCGVAAGRYDIRLNASKFLSRKLQNQFISGTGVDVGSIYLPGGDLDNDEEVGPADFELAVTYFGTSNPLGDADEDGEVGPADFELITQNFGLLGE
jgi:hypothetical protein